MAELEVTQPGADGTPFSVGPVHGYAPTADEAAWCERANALLAELSKPGTDPTTQAAPDALKERDKFVARLRQRADLLCALEQPQRDAEAREALRDSYWDEGVYTDRIARINDLPFSVEPEIDPQSRLITDLHVTTRDKNIPGDKQQFKVLRDQAVTVVKTVFADLDAPVAATPENPSPAARLRAWLMNLYAPPPSGNDAVRSSEYLKTLLGIAHVGLMALDASQTPFAVLALTGFKNEFVAREAGRVKNRYVRRLGMNALVALIAFAACYALTLLMVPSGWILFRFRNFFVLAASAAVGTWLSFSIRRQVLSFEDLATLEDDRLNPGVRVLFMVALTTVVGLIFWTGMVTVVIGNFRTDFRLTGSYAALIGALCGIAERSLAGAVGRRASELVAGIGGTTGKTAA